ncbi:MAG: MFS transporter [Acidobacteria bacterium]|nr:MFS transporter [Acidobacteriota bacterium]
MGTTTTNPLAMRDVLANRLFRRLWLAQMVSIFGDFVAIYAVFSVVSFRMRGTAAEVSGIMVSFLLPLALIGPVAGVFVDRWDVRRTMISSDLIRAVLVLLLMFATTPVHIYAIFFVLSAVSSFFIPAQTTALPLLVQKEALFGANAIMQQTMQLVRIVSPAVAGALAGSVGENACYWLDSLSFVFSAAMIATLRIPGRPAGGRTVSAILQDLSSGLRFILNHAEISFVILSLTAGTFALSCFSALVAVYVRDILHSGSAFFGALGSLIGLGTILGSLLVARVARKASRAHLVTIGILGNGIFIFLLAFFHTSVTTIACCLGVGFSVAFILIPASTLMQEETPQEMRGRVSSSSMSLIALAQGVALVLAGSLAARFGIINLYLGSAAMLVLVAAVGYFQLRRATSPPIGDH